MDEKAEDKGPASQMIRLDADLWRRVSEIAAKTGRKPRQEVEQRLRESLDAGGDMPQWARVVGQHLALLAADAADGSQSADEALAALKAQAAGYFDGLLAAFRKALGNAEMQRIENEDRADNEAAGRAFAQRVLEAHEADKQPSPARMAWLEVARPSYARKPDQLAKDQKVLMVSPEALEKIAPARRKVGKGKK